MIEKIFLAQKEDRIDREFRQIEDPYILKPH
jgi:hypothetical protein